MKQIHLLLRQRMRWLALAALPLLALDLRGAQIVMERAVDSGGAGNASAASYALTDTTGQPCVTTASSANYAVANGFWPDYGAAPTVPASFTLGATYGQTVNLPILQLLQASTDPNGETLSLASVSGSTNGAVVARVGDIIEYTPADGITGQDSFTYVITDANGDATVGTVTVNITGASGGTYNLSATLLGNGDMQVAFLGIPNLRYALERTYNLTPPVNWVPQFTNVAAPNGMLAFTNTPTPGTNNFWRTRYVP